jgi:hypothetical protein
MINMVRGVVMRVYYSLSIYSPVAYLSGFVVAFCLAWVSQFVLELKYGVW